MTASHVPGLCTGARPFRIARMTFGSKLVALPVDALKIDRSSGRRRQV
jgi:hypothetical protein